jgi:hypothetical protein
VTKFGHFVTTSLKDHVVLHHALQGIQILPTFPGDNVTTVLKNVRHRRGAFVVIVLREARFRAIVFDLPARHRLSANDGAKRVWFFDHRNDGVCVAKIVPRD